MRRRVVNTSYELVKIASVYEAGHAVLLQSTAGLFDTIRVTRFISNMHHFAR